MTSRKAHPEFSLISESPWLDQSPCRAIDGRSALRHLDGDAEEAIVALSARDDLDPCRVGQLRLTPHAVGAHTLADALAVERGRPRNDGLAVLERNLRREAARRVRGVCPRHVALREELSYARVDEGANLLSKKPTFIARKTAAVRQ